MRLKKISFSDAIPDVETVMEFSEKDFEKEFGDLRAKDRAKLKTILQNHKVHFQLSPKHKDFNICKTVIRIYSHLLFVLFKRTAFDNYLLIIYTQNK